MSASVLHLDQLQEERKSTQISGRKAAYDELRGLLKERRLS